MGTGPDAGWYDDGTGKQRWWDGSRWTTHYIDLGEPDIELRTDTGPPAMAQARAGWYDDGRGRQRWWDGARWTDAARFSGEEQSLGGIVVDGRWIHFGASVSPSREPPHRTRPEQSSSSAGDSGSPPSLGSSLDQRAWSLRAF